jgi:hypothetical protein
MDTSSHSHDFALSPDVLMLTRLDVFTRRFAFTETGARRFGLVIWTAETGTGGAAPHCLVTQRLVDPSSRADDCIERSTLTLQR